MVTVPFSSVAFANRKCRIRRYVFTASTAFVRSFCRFSGQIWLSRYFVNGLSSLDENYMEYSVATADELIRFCRSKVKGQGQSISSSSNLVNTVSYEIMGAHGHSEIMLIYIFVFAPY